MSNKLRTVQFAFCNEVLVLSCHLLWNNQIIHPHLKVIWTVMLIQIRISISHQWMKSSSNINYNLPNKTGSGVDNISNRLLKQMKHVIVQPLILIINQSLTSSIYPYKISKIPPTTKFTSKYRRIPLLTTTCM